MVARRSFSVGHTVRMLAADAVLAAVAVALLVCNVRGDHRVLLPATGRMDDFITYRTESRSWEHGWPVPCLERRGPPATDGLARVWRLPDYTEVFPRLGVHEQRDVWWVWLAVDVLVALIILASTAYVTRRLLRTDVAPFQVTLMTVVLLPGILVVGCIVAGLPSVVTRVVLGSFLWLGIACVPATAAMLYRRRASKRA